MPHQVWTRCCLRCPEPCHTPGRLQTQWLAGLWQGSGGCTAVARTCHTQHTSEHGCPQHCVHGAPTHGQVVAILAGSARGAVTLAYGGHRGCGRDLRGNTLAAGINYSRGRRRKGVLYPPGHRPPQWVVHHHWHAPTGAKHGASRRLHTQTQGVKAEQPSNRGEA